MKNSKIQKKWYTSKTFWVNIITALIAVIALVQEISPFPEEYAWVLVFLAGVANVVLRVFFTEQPIERSIK